MHKNSKKELIKLTTVLFSHLCSWTLSPEKIQHLESVKIKSSKCFSLNNTHSYWKENQKILNSRKNTNSKLSSSAHTHSTRNQAQRKKRVQTLLAVK